MARQEGTPRIFGTCSLAHVTTGQGSAGQGAGARKRRHGTTKLSPPGAHLSQTSYIPHVDLSSRSRWGRKFFASCRPGEISGTGRQEGSI